MYSLVVSTMLGRHSNLNQPNLQDILTHFTAMSRLRVVKEST